MYGLFFSLIPSLVALFWAFSISVYITHLKRSPNWICIFNMTAHHWLIKWYKSMFNCSSIYVYKIPFNNTQYTVSFITARVWSRASVCLCVCLSMCLSSASCPHYCTDPDVTCGSGRGCPLVVHCWADLQSVHGMRCYDNIMEMRGRAQR